MNIEYARLNLVSKTGTEKKISKRRHAKTGGNVDHPSAIELRAIDEEVHLTGAEFIDALIEFDGLPFTREVYQSYLQGYVRTDESYENLLKRVRPFLAHRRKLYSHLMKPDMRTIFDAWLKVLNIDSSGKNGSPFRLFVELVKPKSANGTEVDPSSLFRWYQKNKKPSSINLLILLDQAVQKKSKKRS